MSMDWIDIVNVGLVEAGAEPIVTGVSNDSERSVNVVLPLARRAVLRAHPWNFATEYDSLPAAGGAPKWRYAKHYALPSDPWCVFVREADTELRWEVAGRKLLTDAEAPLDVVYTGEVADPNVFDGLAAMALGTRVGASVLYRLSQNRTQAEWLAKRYQEVLREARSVDGQEGYEPPPDDSDFLAARF